MLAGSVDTTRRDTEFIVRAVGADALGLVTEVQQLSEPAEPVLLGV